MPISISGDHCNLIRKVVHNFLLLEVCVVLGSQIYFSKMDHRLYGYIEFYLDNFLTDVEASIQICEE